MNAVGRKTEGHEGAGGKIAGHNDAGSVGIAKISVAPAGFGKARRKIDPMPTKPDSDVAASQEVEPSIGEVEVLHQDSLDSVASQELSRQVETFRRGKRIARQGVEGQRRAGHRAPRWSLTYRFARRWRFGYHRSSPW
ncbi:hypothetical protein GCM10012284_02810 [Mangrovihabitans endophyticus]|uniref:Uncharacterized protein n=1 Tax=Mangrovihabitans endophyticus TaxID=1751298 RepID=A0A8J3FKD9_9ACTN|nr:hypothetical protein GCM10012284_02810 [Mangrovihabitans endophyticus]